MALTQCPDCGREVSTEARSCPHCGRPIATGVPPLPRPHTPPTKKDTPALAIILIVIGILALLGGGLSFLNYLVTTVAPPLDQAEANAKATQMVVSIISMIGGAISIGLGTFAKALINK